MIVTDPAAIDSLLLQGERIADVMARTSWPRKNVLRRTRMLGMLVNPATDVPIRPSAEAVGRARRAVLAKPQENPVSTSNSIGNDSWGEILAAGLQSTNPAVKRKAELAMAAMQGLRKVIADEREAVQVREQIEAKAAELAELRAKAKRLGVRPLGSTPRPDRTEAQRRAAIESNRNRSLERDARHEALGASPDQVREWCRANGVKVSDFGWLSNASLDAYEQAHQGADESA